MQNLSFVFILAFLFVIELVYFKIAKHYNIIDKPNHRSSHATITIRGGGILFGVAVLFNFFLNHFQYPLFTVGLIMISTISFLDDVLTLNNKVRLGVHLIAVILLIFQWGIVALPIYFVPILVILIIGTINAYNFMDGINGITGGYSLLLICSAYYLNENVSPFISGALLAIIGLSLLVFNFFNFRKVAKCFAGDVGSVGIAFIIVFIVGQLIVTTGNFSYVLLLFLYGLDSVTTILFRLIRKENIFEAHRSHFYQFLANEKKWPHLSVSLLYIVVQFMINICLIFCIKQSMPLAIYFFIGLSISFLILRFLIEGPAKLLNKKIAR